MPFCVIKSKTIKIALAMILVALLLTLSIEGSSAASVFFGNSSRKVPIYRVQTEEKQVAISFDAAWGADKTEEILEVLSSYNATATFFLVGFWVDKYPEMVTAIDEAGMEIGTHSNTHPDMVKLDSETIKKELETSTTKIENLTGKKVSLFRAPYGSYNNTLLSTCENMGLNTIQWDVDSLDWKGLSSVEVTTRVLDRVQNGSIILCHNNADNVVESTKMILERLTMKGYKVTCVGDLIYHDNFVIDSNGVQNPK